MILTLKLKLTSLLINSIWKYNKENCPEKFMETTIDDLTTLIKL